MKLQLLAWQRTFIIVKYLISQLLASFFTGNSSGTLHYSNNLSATTDKKPNIQLHLSSVALSNNNEI